MTQSLVTLLIVEDEAATAFYIKKMLMKRGFDVVKCVASGEEAVESAKALKPAMVLMDIELAGEMNGVEAASLIKDSTESEIIFMSGYSDPDLKRRAMELNPLNYFVKPVNMDELIEVIYEFSPEG